MPLEFTFEVTSVQNHELLDSAKCDRQQQWPNFEFQEVSVPHTLFIEMKVRYLSSRSSAGPERAKESQEFCIR